MHAEAPSILRALIDADALAQNVAAIRERIGERTLMAIVKGDAYGHGAAHVVPAVLAAGVRRFGVATLAEALDLHEQLAGLPFGDEATLLFWLHDDTTDLAPALARGFEVGLSTADGFARAGEAARRTGKVARVHLKVDTGLGRGGFSPAQLSELLGELGGPGAGSAGAPAGDVQIVGLMSHLANADLPGDPATHRQKEAFASFHDALADFLAGTGARFASTEGLTTHTANSPGALGDDDVPGDTVRVGLSLYGLSPFEHVSARDLGLRPAMTLSSRVLTVKDVPAGHGASYGLTYTTKRPTRFALVAGGYADGIPRPASGRAEVTIRGRRLPVVGRIAMDQMIVDAGETPVQTGDPVTVLGDGLTGPSAEEWGEWAGTINYEIVTRIGPRVDRVGAGAPGDVAQNPVSVTLTVPGRAAMADLAEAVGRVVRAGDVLVLTGNLGAGKTTFTQFLARSLDVRGRVSSPTFVIAREHPPRGAGPGLIHADAYRLGGADEFDDLGLDAWLDESVTVVEWGRGMAETLGGHLDVEILRDAETLRGAEALRDGGSSGDVVSLGDAVCVSDADTARGMDHEGAAPEGGAADGDGYGYGYDSQDEQDEDGSDDEFRTVVLTAHGDTWTGRLTTLRAHLSGGADAGTTSDPSTEEAP
ncbi:alanine racemase [Brevibacterium jeotgali]|uniref:Alanine racemase n=1 Tax=Brevibacterium jeotgali TaxID=1262550 RepID=A0A2H1L5V5_9MICO|nr:alanine racemase [Brevibacterium jeotgali]TWB98909.1 alanine racemase [Brevibacterium jeotgali]SMY12259.1 alanine racemase [Brevibacterium jeotgali]